MTAIDDAGTTWKRQYVKDVLEQWDNELIRARAAIAPDQILIDLCESRIRRLKDEQDVINSAPGPGVRKRKKDVILANLDRSIEHAENLLVELTGITTGEGRAAVHKEIAELKKLRGAVDADPP